MVVKEKVTLSLEPILQVATITDADISVLISAGTDRVPIFGK